MKAFLAQAAPGGAKFFSPGVEPFDTGHATSFLQPNVPAFTGGFSPASLASDSRMGRSALPATLGLSATEAIDLGATNVANRATSAADLAGLLSGPAPNHAPLSPPSPRSRLLSATVAVPGPATLTLAGIGLVVLMGYVNPRRFCSRTGAVERNQTGLSGCQENKP